MEIDQREIENYLKEIREAVSVARYQIAIREKNLELYMDYVFSESQCRKILLSLNVGDFSEAVWNIHPRYGEEILYIFGKEVWLLPRLGGAEEQVLLYLKLNKLPDQYVIVVSCHRQEFPLTYRFRI
ncbi:MAG: hypothetical protein IKM28_01570 [Lachnospiraceae bacterium]|nr:hypothetical protein [Lachnospiraceae bacterium]